MVDILWVREPPAIQTPNERILYTVTSTNWVSSPSGSAAKAYDENQNDKDVTTTVFPTNSPSESGDVVSLSLLRELTEYHNYRIEVAFDVGSGTYEPRLRVICVPYYIVGGLSYQSAGETVPYKIVTTAWESTPTSVVVTAYDENQGNLDVTSTIISDSTPTPSGDNITIIVKSLTKGHSYRVACKFTVSTEIFEPSFRVKCLY